MAPDRQYGTRTPVVKRQGGRLRADAARNRELVLRTADEVFAAEGMGVPIDEIARRAGVGPGTLYRHFPTKEALFMAVAVNRVHASIEEARRLFRVADPAAALFEYLRGLGAQFQARKDLIEVLAAGGQSLHQVHPEVARELNSAIEALLRRAQAAGAVRKDVRVDDVMNLVVGVYEVVRQFRREPQATDRLLTVVFDGLRATGGESDVAGTKQRAKRRNSA